MDEIELLKKRLERERKARKQAEQVLEEKALQLYKANEELRSLNNSLEQEIQIRTQKLLDTETRYQHLVENANDIIYNTDEFGNFLYVNKIGLEKFGYPLEELKGVHFFKFIPIEHQEDVFQFYVQMRENEEYQSYKEFPVLTVNDKIIWVGQNVNRVDTKEGFYFTAVARDISQRKATEDALKIAREAIVKSEIKYRSIIENMNLGLLEVDTDGNILRVYDGFNRMLGYKKNELVGKNAMETLVVPGFEHFVQKSDEARLRGETGAYEIKIKKKDGTEFWVLISGAPFYNENSEVAGSIGIHFDITDQKNMEAELKKAREIAISAQQAEKQFLASMSHEIRTPLNAIIGMSHLLADTSLDAQQEEYLEIFSSSASILKNLISDILDISKIDAGTLEVQEKPFDVHQLCSSIMQTFAIKSLDKEIKFEVFIDDKIDHYLLGDQQLLNQVLLNLVSNADKFTEKGSISIHVDVEREELNSSKIKFSVKDTGIGIDTSKLNIIFEQFKQANKEIRNEYGGTGLGLAISKKLINLMGGEIFVESKKGKGSNFYFSLKLQKGEQINTANNILLKSDKVFYGNQEKVLVVEDNLMNQKYIGTLLKKWNLNYTIANNGQEAIDLFKDHNYEVIFMDLQMPVLDGFEATHQIRAYEGNQHQTPIIALTASTFLSKKQLALEAGMTDFISKPFTPDQLAEVINKYIKSNPKTESKSESKHTFNSTLDKAYLIEAYGDDQDYAKEMFETFLEIIDDEMTNLKECIASKNLEDIKKQAHKIKPTFTMVGLSSISDSFQKMENAAASKDMKGVLEMNKIIQTSFKENLPLVQEELQRLSK